jgi:hypothetical protein
MKHYLLCPVKPLPPRMPPPPRNSFPVQPPPPPPKPAAQPRSSVRHQIAELFRYTFDGLRGFGV